jgi:ribosomal protein S18 acetylase RimI-like enzyme
MNAEILAEWFRRQGHSVVKTASSYWCNLGPRAFQAIPFCWTIEPDESELRNLLLVHVGIGLRYSAPADWPKGVTSYHVTCEDPAYDIALLPRQSKQNVKKGLACCEIAPISFGRLAIDGWQLHCDTLKRHNRKDFLSEKAWQRSCLAAEDLPGFEAWGAMIQGQLAAAIVFARVYDWIILLSQDSLTALIHANPNHALIYCLTKELVSRKGTRAIFYTLQSLDASPCIDDFKLRMGYKKVSVKQCVVFHPIVLPLVNRHSLHALTGLHRKYPSNLWLAKAEGLVRFSLDGKFHADPIEHPEVIVAQLSDMDNHPPNHIPLTGIPLIRFAYSDDLAAIVRVHLSSFPNFFLSFLGERFLTLLYREILREDGNVSLVVVGTKNQILGFAVGVVNQVGLYLRLAKKRWFAFAMASIHIAIRHPLIIPRLIRGLRYPAIAAEAACPALLMSIAVAPDAQGKGLGRALIDRFLSEMLGRGVDRVSLTTDRDGNDSTNSFYQKFGFSKTREFRTHERRWMNEYVIQTMRLAVPRLSPQLLGRN